jgi:hypothetical protein
LDWSPLDAPKDAEEHMRRVSLDSAMLEREPSRKDDYIDFTYLDMLPVTKGIVEEKLIASGPAMLFLQINLRMQQYFLQTKGWFFWGSIKE